MTLLSKRPLAARACLALVVGIVLPACDHRPMHINPVYDPSAPENAGYTPRRGPDHAAPHAAIGTPDEAMLRKAFARNPSSADVAYLRTIKRPLTPQEIADVSVVITRDLCGIPENQRMSPDGNCALAQ